MRKGKIVIDNFSGGWSNDFAKSATISSPQTTRNTYYSGLFNINKPNYLGQISQALTDSANPVFTNGLSINATKSSTNRGAFISSTGVINEFNLTTAFPSPVTNWNAAFGSATVDNFKDIWTHRDNLGNEVYYYTYQTATEAFVGIHRPNTATGSNATFITLANRNVLHAGCVSVGNRSFFTDGNFLKSYSPDSNTPAQINIGIGYTLRSVCDYGTYAAAVGDNGTSARMWLWNGTSTDANFQYEIRDTNVTAVVNEGGDLRVFTFGKNGTTKIKTYNGNGFSEEADWEIPTTLCASPLHGMVDVWLNQIVWKSPDHFIWTYGSPRKNEFQSGANRVGKLSNTVGNTLGCVKNLYEGNLYLGAFGVDSNNYIYLINSETYVLGSINFKTNLYTLPHNSTIKVIHIYFSQFNQPNANQANGLTFKLYSGYNTTDFLLNKTIPALPQAGSLKYYPVLVSANNLDTFYLDINQANTGMQVIIKKIEVEYTFEEGDI